MQSISYIFKACIAFFLLFGSLSCTELTFLAADIKYSENYGIKICEIQGGSFSGFVGFDKANKNPGFFAKTFCDRLSEYIPMMWFVSPNVCDETLKKEFIKRGWLSFPSLEALIKDPSFLEASKGAVYSSRLKVDFIKSFEENYPSLILMDAKAAPFLGDKFLMSQLFKNEELKSYKPRWNNYPKHYEKGLAKKIISEIASDKVVIKPRKSSLGRGIIIAEKTELDTILKTILLTKMIPLRKNPDPCFSYWGYDKSDSFIVEEFVESDPIMHNNKAYDGIVRISFIIAKTTKGIKIDFMPPVWIIPVKSLSDEGTLTEKHKSCPQELYFVKVEDIVKEKVEAHLLNLLPILYQKMLESQ